MRVVLIVLVVCLILSGVSAAKKQKQVLFSYYQLLDIKRDASPSDVKKAYFAMAKKYHPDKSTEENKEKNRELYEKVQHAYSVLSDAKRRDRYDYLLSVGQFEYTDAEIRREENGQQEDEARREWEEEQKKAYEEAELKRNKQKEREEYLNWWSSALSIGFFSLLVSWGIAQAVAQLRQKSIAKQEIEQKREDNISKLKTKQQLREEKKERNRAMQAQLIKEEQERQRLWEEKLKSGEVKEEDEYIDNLVFEINESKVPQYEESGQSLENFNEIIQEQLDEIKQSKETHDVDLFCIACRKKFKSPNSWSNHLPSKKHKTAEKKLKGDKLEEYHERLRDIELYIAQSATEYSDDEEIIEEE